MRVRWKIFFFVLALIEVPDLWYSLSNFSKLSSGDWIDTIISLLITAAVFIFAFNKKIFKAFFWKIFFWVVLIGSILTVITIFIQSTFLDTIFAMQFKANGLANMNLAVKILSLIFGLHIYIPALLAIFYLGYKKESDFKEIKEKKDAPYSKLAIASFVLGLSSLLFGLLTSIPAVITGFLGLRNIRKGDVKGVAFAWTGIIIFIIQSAITFFIAMVIVYLLSMPGVIDGYKNAVNHMSKDELQYYNDKIAKIKQDSTVEDVNRLLGEPFTQPKDAVDGSYLYHCPENFVKNCTINITITDHVVSNIMWIDYVRFWFQRAFTEADKTYIYGENIHLTLTLEPGWSEYTYSEKEQQDSPPLTFSRKNGNGYLYIYQYDLPKPFDINAEVRDYKDGLRPKESDIKKYSLRDWTIYEFSGKKDGDFYHFTYLVKPRIYFLAAYYSGGKNVSRAELDEAIKIIKTFEVEEK